MVLRLLFKVFCMGSENMGGIVGVGLKMLSCLKEVAYVSIARFLKHSVGSDKRKLTVWFGHHRRSIEHAIH